MASLRKNKMKDSPSSLTEKRGLKTFFAILGSLLILAVILVFIAFIAASLMDSAPQDRPAGKLLFTIAKGETGISVARRLETEGMIRSQLFFRALIALSPENANLKAGSYWIESAMGSMAILELLKSGKEVLVKVLVPEGYTLRQLAAVLEKNTITNSIGFIAAAADPVLLREMEISAKTAEGFLFPDTYLFARNMEPKAVVRSLVANFRAKLETEIPESSFLTAQEVFERITLASIVEREYRIPEEAALMAGVFFNRIRQGIRLGSCATVVYVMTEILRKEHPEKLLFADLETDSPYNTYLYNGLPPGPICSPGLHALKAAFNPAPTSYLYFRVINPSTGKHHFSETYAEHLGVDPLYVKGLGS